MHSIVYSPLQCAIDLMFKIENFSRTGLTLALH